MFKSKREQQDSVSSNVRRTAATAGIRLSENTQALQAQQDDGLTYALIDAACR